MVNFPTSLDSLANPGPGTYEDDVGFVHSDQHANANDILEALEGKLGIGRPGGDRSSTATSPTLPSASRASRRPPAGRRRHRRRPST
jgi:hypothetical protein